MGARGLAFAIAIACLAGCGERSDLFGTPDVDAAADAPEASPPTSDAGADARPSPGIRCAAHDCDVGAGEVCCRSGNAEPFLYACAREPCPSGSLAIRCDDPADCPRGDVCCGVYDERANVVDVVCRAASECTDKQLGVPVCDPTADMPCPLDAGTCNPSMQTLLGYSICL